MKFGRQFVASLVLGLLLAPSSASALLAEAEPAVIERLRRDAREAAQRSETFIWPVAARRITTHFDGGHAGIDIDGEAGDRIVAARSGIVTFAGDDGDGYGLKVIIRHPGGLQTLYSHLASVDVERGPIEQGTYLGPMGCTGSCSGDHLHFEILKNGSPTNPLDYLP